MMTYKGFADSLRSISKDFGSCTNQTGYASDHVEDAFKTIKDESFVLDDGTVVKRAYPSDMLEFKRISCLNKMGSKWLLHASNHINKK